MELCLQETGRGGGSEHHHLDCIGTIRRSSPSKLARPHGSLGFGVNRRASDEVVNNLPFLLAGGILRLVPVISERTGRGYAVRRSRFLFRLVECLQYTIVLDIVE